MFPAGLPFPVPDILEFIAFLDAGTFSTIFQGLSRSFSPEPPKHTPEAATAFSSFLQKKCPAK